jgi:L-amino acid N-acyltransferase YncA
MTPTTRPAHPADAAEMAALLNEIIALGGTTAYEDPFSPNDMDHHYISNPARISCTVAEEAGEILGFQGLFWPDDPADPFPEGWAYIATFARVGRTGRGIGKALFAATLAAARTAAVQTIDATIRADNAGGLAYYGQLGFTDYARLHSLPLKDGTPVDRVRKRFDP